jgi:hypothetical protein
MPKLIPRTKQTDVPYQWFRTQVVQLEIRIEQIDMKGQLVDQFTRSLLMNALCLATKHLMDW